MFNTPCCWFYSPTIWFNKDQCLVYQGPLSTLVTLVPPPPHHPYAYQDMHVSGALLTCVRPPPPHHHHAHPCAIITAARSPL